MSSPSFREVARLAVDGTDGILSEAQRRFGPMRTKLSRQEKDDLQNIWTLLTELISVLIRSGQNPPPNHGAK